MDKNANEQVLASCSMKLTLEMMSVCPTEEERAIQTIEIDEIDEIEHGRLVGLSKPKNCHMCINCHQSTMGFIFTSAMSTYKGSD